MAPPEAFAHINEVVTAQRIGISGPADMWVLGHEKLGHQLSQYEIYICSDWLA